MCPYETWKQANLIFCEIRQCSWIREPANTVSNLGFLFVGIYLLAKYYKTPQLRVIGLAAILVSLFSGFFHASATYVGEVLDFGSMYMLMGGLAMFNIQRMALISVKTSEILALVMSVLGMITLAFDVRLGSYIFASLILVALILEGILYRKMSPRANYKFFGLAILCNTTAYVIWFLDIKKIICVPDSLFQGHAVWHLMGGFTFLFIAKFYRQFSDVS